MKALITGCGGFIGSHFADFLLDKGFDVTGIISPHDQKDNTKEIKKDLRVVSCDITNKIHLERIVLETNPEYVFHFAAQSLVIPSWKDPEWTYKTNVLGTLYLLEAINKLGEKPLTFVACSSAEYGFLSRDELPISETQEFRPSSHYAVSKVATDMLAYLYAKVDHLPIIRIRFFNISGPRKIFDMCSDFARAVVAIERGEQETIHVGNLDSIRDITDVRDAVKALWILMQHGVYGDAYNICSGQQYHVKKILDTFISLSNVPIRIEVDQSKFRPLDDPIFVGDNSKMKAFGWSPKIPIQKTLEDMLTYWRS